jgi:cell division protein FtsB
MSARAATSPAARGAASEPRTRISARATLLLLFVLIAATLSITPMRAFLEMRDRVAGLEREARVLESGNDRLESQIARLNDPVYLERVARACLGMVEPGEIAFVMVPEEGAKPIVADC